MSAGPGTESRIYKTTDGGKAWALQFQNADPAGFFDALAFCNQLSEKEQRTRCYRLASIERDNGSIKSAEVAVVNGATGYRLRCRLFDTMRFQRAAAE